MPRGIGTSSGVKLTADRDRPRRAREVLDDLGGVPVDAADAVGAGVAHHLAGQQVGLGRLARAAECRRRPPRRPRAPRGRRRRRRQGERGHGRVAAGHRDPGGAGQLLALAGQLGQAVGPGAGVAAAVELLPHRGVDEPEVGSAVDDHAARVLLAQSGGDLAGLPVRQAPGRPRRGRRASRRWSAPAPGRPAAPGAAGGCPAAHRRWRRRSARRSPPGGGPSSRRSTSPPAYPLAPATATRVLVMCMTIHRSAWCMRHGSNPVLQRRPRPARWHP